MIREMRIEDSLDDMKRILYYYFDTIDYTTYIRDIKRIIDSIKEAIQESLDSEQIERLKKLEERANFYLERMQNFQSHYENKGEEPGM